MDKYSEMMGQPVDEKTGRKFKKWQNRTIYGSMIAYSLFYVVRKNLSMAIPAMESDASLHFTKADLGLFLTLGGLVYGISKFTNGILGDRLNARYFMMFGLVMCALCNFVFGLSSVVWIFGLIWILNNWFQGIGYPPCARLLTHWVHPKEMATKMSIWNVAHSIGAFVAIVICGYVVVMGWRWCFYIPAMIGMSGVLFIWYTLRDTPTSVGLPEVVAGKFTDTIAKKKTNTEFKQILIKRVFKNPYIWILAFSNFFVYVVRFAFLDWGPTMLQQWMGVTPSQSGWLIGFFEVFGMVGMLMWGWLTDKYFGGRGARVCVICMFFIAICVALFWFWHDKGLPFWGSAVFLFLLGFLIYGPQTLIGICAANIATKDAAATAVGLTGLFAYISTIFSGWGIGALVDYYTVKTVTTGGKVIVDSSIGWGYTFGALVIISCIGALVVALVWNAKPDGYDD